MIVCSLCKKNAAVVYTARYEAGRRVTEGLCLKCAYNTGIGMMGEMFRNSGITEENVDAMTEQLNSLMAQSESGNPQEVLKALMSGLEQMAGELPDSGSGAGEPPEEPEEEPSGTGGGLSPRSLGPVASSPGARSLDGPLGFRDASDDDTSRDTRSAPGDRTAEGPGRDRRDRKKRFLDQFGTDLTRRARQGGIDRIIGRTRELERVIQILNRRNKNNPVLLGEPGVGKTAIAEGLALKITLGEVPAKLLHQEVYLLDMTAMVAGTQFRGQFESRMKGVVDEARKAGNVILVIDELHNIMGAGDAEGAMNAANILKPALAKGEIRVLGSTTLDEYRRFVEKDSALERRFQPVIVKEPSVGESFEILKGIREYYEAHHHVTFSDEVLEAAVRLSERYIHDRFLPDKAIDLLDEAGSRANLDDIRLSRVERLKEELETSRGQLADIEANPPQAGSPRPEGEEGDRIAFYERQAQAKTHVLHLEEEIRQLEDALSPTPVSVEDIARVVEMWTGIPVQRITETESSKLLNLEERLHRRVIGQEQAVSSLARAIRRNRAGLGKKRKPASFLFVGPTGVGKTELVKALAEVLFQSEEALVRLDMSEFMEPHTVSKLIGSPPGYVGYDDGGQLTERIRRNPYSVILLDEIEKAHADVFNILLQILDDGRLTDSHGRTVSFENTVLVMTSNAGTTLKAQGFGFGAEGQVAIESRVQTVLKELFRPEFLNRVDEIVVFKELAPAEIRQIVDLMLKEVEGHLAIRHIRLAASDPVRDRLAEMGFDNRYGARPLRKTIQRHIEDPLADRLLNGSLRDGDQVALALDDGGGFRFDVERPGGTETERKAD